MYLQLIYLSKSADGLTHDDVLEIVEESRRNNTFAGVTGLLLHLDGAFAQVIEGPEAEIRSLYKRLRNDPRHGEVHIVYETMVPERMFEGWTMGYVETDLGDMLRSAGLDDVEAALALIELTETQTDAGTASSETALGAAIARALSEYSARLSHGDAAAAATLAS